VASALGFLASTPVLDGTVAVIPGLAGQSRVSNNLEINNLRLGPCAVAPNYFAVRSNFEPEDPGWKFWQNFRLRAGNKFADLVFPDQNDLVVDTKSMTELGGDDFPIKINADICDFKTSTTVWHCNYFRQPETIDKISTKWLI
jgi:hypothetical protein